MARRNVTKQKTPTQKQRIFAEEYARCLNGAEAARRAGYSEDRARQTAFDLLNRERYAHVRELVDDLIADDAAQKRHDWDSLRRSWRSRIELDVRTFFDKSGQPRSPTALTKDQAQHISSYTVSEQGSPEKGFTRNITLKLTNVDKAREAMAKHSGFFEPRLSNSENDEYLQASQELEAMLEEAEEELEEDSSDDSATTEEEE